MAERIGEFQVLGSLGKGANSTILHIRRSADSKQYALKIVPISGPEDRKYLEQGRTRISHCSEIASPEPHSHLRPGKSATLVAVRRKRGAAAH
jgi:hypothetical protein